MQLESEQETQYPVLKPPEVTYDPLPVPQ